MNPVLRLVVLVVYFSSLFSALCPAANAAPLQPVSFDAAVWDWAGVGLFNERALIVLDNRAGAEPKWFDEVAMTSASWSNTSMGGSLGDSPWGELIGYCDPVVIGDIKWSVGTMWYTSSSRPFPTAQPIAFWLDLTTIPPDPPEDPNAPPILPDEGDMPGYVPPGMWWVIAPTTTGSFFASPATCEVAGVQYADADEMPTFDGLADIPEPATLVLLAIGVASLPRRKKR